MTTVVRSIHIVRKARRKRVVLGPEAPKAELPGRVPRVARLMALAIKYDRLLRKGVVADLSELARLSGRQASLSKSCACPLAARRRDDRARRHLGARQPPPDVRRLIEAR